MKILLTGLLALVFATPALAAPPANDNREDAFVLPTFPATVQGTTAEATVERLDPQVSRCGRIEGTVWYRIEAAPDGTIVTTVQASAALAPVVRIYRRNSSSIDEVSCGNAKAGGKVVTSVATVRGAGYLILVGHRPGTSAGAFDLRADLALPPDNDEMSEAAAIPRLPASVRGTTLGATYDYSRCGGGAGTVWYRVKAPASGRMLVALATGDRDGVVGVLRRERSNLDLLGCTATDRHGNAVLGISTKPGADYLILVADKPGSPPGGFVLTLKPGDAPERLPGRALPNGGVRSSVNGLTDVNDVWSVRLRRGTTYRIAFSSKPCAAATLRTATRVFPLGCRAYTSFTPGRDGGGLYSFEVLASTSQDRQAYRLLIAPASADDVGVGVELRGGSTAHGRLTPNGIDVVDLYHFDVERLSEVRLRLGRAADRRFSMLLLTDAGKRIEAGDGTMRRRLNRGRYVVAVGAPAGTRPGGYRLSLLLRDVTTTAVLVSGKRAAEVLPGATVTLACVVAPASHGGRVELEIDRFDPLTGWHFHRIIRIAAGSALAWRPPAAGRWRMRARFLGTQRSAPSRSGYTHLLVARPIR